MSFKDSTRQAKRGFRNNRRQSTGKGRWSNPASLYQNANVSNYDSSSSEDERRNVLSDSSLDGMDIRSASSRSGIHSMMYSEDDSSAKSGTSFSSWMGNRLRSDPLGMNTKPLFMNVDVLQVHEQFKDDDFHSDDLRSTTSSACDTAKSSLADNYFQPSEADNFLGRDALKSLVNDTSIDSDSENYIFTDDDDDDGAKLSRAGKEERSTVPAESIIGDPDASINWRERDWSSFHQRRGRLLAQHLLEQASNRTNTANSSSSSVTDKDMRGGDSDDTGSSNGRRSSFLARAFSSIRKQVGRKKLFAKSSSPLDKARSKNSWMKLGDESSQSVISARKTVQSAVLTRNHLAEFDSWEAFVVYDTNLNKLSALPEDDREDSAMALDDTSVSSEARDDPYVIKAVSSIGSSIPHVPSLLSANNDFDNDEGEDEIIIFREILDEKRTTSEDIALALGIEQEGGILLKHARSETEKCNSNNKQYTKCHDGGDANDLSLIPMIQLAGDLYLPQYEEYVCRAVNTFSSRLLNLFGQDVALFLDE